MTAGRRPQGVLGRATFPDADLWSCACAIQNLWLAARAEGLGMGWVTLFRPEELAELLGLPDGVVTLGWLCLGWPDERPPEPGLERRLVAAAAPRPGRPRRSLARRADAAAEVPAGRARSGGGRGARDGGDQLLAVPGSLGRPRHRRRPGAWPSGTSPEAIWSSPPPITRWPGTASPRSTPR